MAKPAVTDGIDEAAFNQLANQAVHAIGELLNFPDDWSDRDVQRAKLASTVISNWSKHEQTKSARVAVGFAIARELAKDKDELTRIVTSGLPGVAVVAALTEAR